MTAAAAASPSAQASIAWRIPRMCGSSSSGAAPAARNADSSPMRARSAAVPARPQPISLTNRAAVCSTAGRANRVMPSLGRTPTGDRQMATAVSQPKKA